MTTSPRLMTDDELGDVEHRLDLYARGDLNAMHRPTDEHAHRPQWFLDLADLLTDARLAREQINHLTAELHSHIGGRA